ncbi:MAG: RDD family protein [Thermodesulfobacteriota bacterium]
MKCPKCGFNTFEYLDACKKCGSALEVNPRYKVIYGSFEKNKGQEDVNLVGSKPSKEEIGKPIISTPSVLISSPQESLESKTRKEVIQSTFPPSGYYSLPQETPTYVEEAKRGEEIAVSERKVSKEEIEKSIVSTPSVLVPPSEASLKSKKSNEELVKSPLSTSSYYSSLQESPAFAESEELLPFNLAGMGLRIGAFLLDIIILFMVTTLTLWVGFSLGSIVFDIREEKFINVIVPLYLILFFLSTTYFVFLQGFSGKTIGKMLFGIRVIRTDGESIGFWDALIRWVGYFISLLFIFIGFVWALFDPKRQAWHDKFAETYVVKE